MTTAPFPHVETESVEVTRPAEGVARIRIRSEPLGVLRQGVKRALFAALTGLEDDSTVRCLIVTGAGRAFSVGSDVREFRRDAAWQAEAARNDQGFNMALEHSRLPVIAMCSGLTLGGGNELAIACDLRFAGRAARFGFPEVKVGAFASAGGTQRLPMLVGAGRAMELLLTGRIIDAEEAFAIGLVDFLVDDDALDARTLAFATELASLPADAVAITKRCVTTGLREGRVAGHALENELTVELGLTENAAEGQAAFLEKRPPRFNRGTERPRETTREPQ
jgi:enoyl-CoA hydratase/carnithine racemase